mgnify:FL=1
MTLLSLRCLNLSLGQKVQTRRKELTCQEYKDVLIIKNVVKNYGRAISSFACSRLSIPYLNNIQRELSFNLQSFLTYASNLKNTIQSIPSFRDAILIEENDTVEMKTNKLVFQKIAEIFIKYFSVNWIFSGKLLYKLEYLKLRSIMLKKIKAPNTLTSLKPLASRWILYFL